MEKMTPGIASSRAEAVLYSPSTPSFTSQGRLLLCLCCQSGFLAYSVKSILPYLFFLPVSYTHHTLSFIPCLSSFHFPNICLRPSVFHFFSARSTALTLPPALSPHLFFLTFNLFLTNQLSGMTEQQRLVFRRK